MAHYYIAVEVEGELKVAPVAEEVFSRFKNWLEQINAEKKIAFDSYEMNPGIDKVDVEYYGPVPNVVIRAEQPIQPQEIINTLKAVEKAKNERESLPDTLIN